MKRNRFDEIMTVLLPLIGVVAVLFAWWLLIAAIGGT